MACSRAGQSCRERAERRYLKYSLSRARRAGGSCDSDMKAFRLHHNTMNCWAQSAGPLIFEETLVPLACYA